MLFRSVRVSPFAEEWEGMQNEHFLCRWFH